MSVLDTHASRISPELRDLEARLQFVLEGVGRECSVYTYLLQCLKGVVTEDKLLLQFMHIDPAAPQREFSIVIDASERIYQGLPHFLLAIFLQADYRKTLCLNTPHLIL